MLGACSNGRCVACNIRSHLERMCSAKQVKSIFPMPTPRREGQNVIEFSVLQTNSFSSVQLEIKCCQDNMGGQEVAFTCLWLGFLPGQVSRKDLRDQFLKFCSVPRLHSADSSPSSVSQSANAADYKHLCWDTVFYRFGFSSKVSPQTFRP